ncbi:MAG: hypothetical protein ACM3W4_07360 [Ignavibacteriales bacterium]
MRTARFLIGGMAAALIIGGAARASSLDIFYGGDDPSATVDVDGMSYDLGSNDGWATVKHVEAGDHTLTLHANGGTMTRQFTLTNENAYETSSESGPEWCMELENGFWQMLNEDGCDDAMAYWLVGGDDGSASSR